MDDSQPVAPAPPPAPIWSTYFNHSSPDAFVIHCTDEPALLMSLPRYFLQAASSVFEDMLTVPQPLIDLIPVHTFRLLMRIETQVVHESNYSWIEGGEDFMAGWRNTANYRNENAT